MSFIASIEENFGSSSASGGGSGPRRGSAKEGLDPEKARRMREDKLAQIRKNRRNDLTMTQRRRTLEAPETEGGAPVDEQLQDVLQQEVFGDAAALPSVNQQTPTVSSRDIHLRQLTELPAKLQALMSESHADKCEGIAYFRKILAIAKNPPIGEVVQSGAVPHIISLLAPEGDVGLQFEAAWCITNIACGEHRFVRNMYECSVVPALVSLIAYSQHDKVRSQALWALANLSGDYSESGHQTRDLILGAGAVTPLLWLLSNGEPTGRPPSPIPTLAQMQHLTYIFVNLSKGPANIPLEYFRPMVFAMSELLQSPDEGVYPIIASGICDLCEKSEDYVQIVLEHGLLSRLHSLLHDTKSSDFSVRAFCAIMRSNNLLHVRLVCSTKFPEVFPVMLQKMVGVSSGTTDVGTEICVTLGRLIDVDQNFVPKFIELNIIEALVAAIGKGKTDLIVQAGLIFCSLVTNTTDEKIHFQCFLSIGAMVPLITTESPDLQFLVLQALVKLFRLTVNPAITNHLDSSVIGRLREALAFLDNHVLPEISQVSQLLGEILDATYPEE